MLDVMSPPEVRHIMGIPIGIDARDPDGIDVEVAFDWLREVDAIFSTYREDSDISRLDGGELTLADCRPEVDEVLTQWRRSRPRPSRRSRRRRSHPGWSSGRRPCCSRGT